MNFKMNFDEWAIKEIPNEEMEEKTGDSENLTQGLTEYKEQTIYINEEACDKTKTLCHELCHVFMYEFGHYQWGREFSNEEVCEICGNSFEMISAIINDWYVENAFKDVSNEKDREQTSD